MEVLKATTEIYQTGQLKINLSSENELLIKQIISIRQQYRLKLPENNASWAESLICFSRVKSSIFFIYNHRFG